MVIQLALLLITVACASLNVVCYVITGYELCLVGTFVSVACSFALAVGIANTRW